MVEAHWLVAKEDKLMIVREQIGIYRMLQELRGFNSIVMEHWCRT